MMHKDPYGLPLSTTAQAAQAYNAGLRRILLVQAGAEHEMRTAVRADPGFGLAHAGLALLGHEYGVPGVNVGRSLAAAAAAVERRGTERERSQVAAVAAHVRGEGAAITAHLRAHPRDALMLGIAVPTIAFAGVTEVPEQAWTLVESLAPAYGDDWWYAGMLAFVRQEQGRWAQAAALADRALAAEPASGHAVHARAHVYYETGDHRAGLGWLDDWITLRAPQAQHGAHFSWHAALHELSLEDVAAVRRRYREQLAPPRVTGMRALVDAASLLWRAPWPGCGTTTRGASRRCWPWSTRATCSGRGRRSRPGMPPWPWPPAGTPRGWPGWAGTRPRSPGGSSRPWSHRWWPGCRPTSRAGTTPRRRC
jgi:hypothetical protein